MNQVLLLLLGTLKAGWIEGKTPEEDKYFHIQGRVKNSSLSTQPKVTDSTLSGRTFGRRHWAQTQAQIVLTTALSDCVHNLITQPSVPAEWPHF